MLGLDTKARSAVACLMGATERFWMREGCDKVSLED